VHVLAEFVGEWKEGGLPVMEFAQTDSVMEGRQTQARVELGNDSSRQTDQNSIDWHRLPFNSLFLAASCWFPTCLFWSCPPLHLSRSY